MNMKKPLALLLAAGMTLGLAACGGTQGSTESPAAGGETHEARRGEDAQQSQHAQHVGKLLLIRRQQQHDAAADHGESHNQRDDQRPAAVPRRGEAVLRRRGQAELFLEKHREAYERRRSGYVHEYEYYAPDAARFV